MTGDVHAARAAAYAAHRDARAEGATREEARSAAQDAWDSVIAETRGGRDDGR